MSGEGASVSPQLQRGPRGVLQEEEGKDDGDTLELYQQSLGELLLLLAGELWLCQGQGRVLRLWLIPGTSLFPLQRSRRGGGGSCCTRR